MEDNKLIAEFMGVTLMTQEELNTYYGCPKEEEWNMPTPAQNCGYHSSWDKLVPVMQKLMDLDVPDRYTQTDYHTAYWGLEGLISMLDIDMLHRLTVECIKEYNKDKE